MELIIDLILLLITLGLIICCILAAITILGLIHRAYIKTRSIGQLKAALYIIDKYNLGKFPGYNWKVTIKEISRFDREKYFKSKRFTKDLINEINKIDTK